MVPCIQQQPLSVFAAHFTKIPPRKKKEIKKLTTENQLNTRPGVEHQNHIMMLPRVFEAVNVGLCASMQAI